MIIAYTIGHTKNYKKNLAQEPIVFKLGKKEDYDGGWIWRTAQEAKEFISSPKFLEINWGDGKPRNPDNFSVSKVILENGWDKDVSPVPGTDGIFNLLVDSKLMEL